jgi:hypothetical protein
VVKRNKKTLKLLQIKKQREKLSVKPQPKIMLQQRPGNNKRSIKKRKNFVKNNSMKQIKKKKNGK